MLPPRTVTWIVVADGARARVFANEAPGRSLMDVDIGERERPVPRTAELGTDRPGRSFDSAQTGGRHAMEPRVDWHRYEKDQFARGIARLLDQAATRGDYDKLVLVAPPQTLGELRACLDAQTRKRVLAEIDKDLTKHRPDELPRHLEGVLRL